AIVRAMILDERFVAITVTESATNRSFVELRRAAGEPMGEVSRQKDILRDGQKIGTVEVVVTLESYLGASRSRLQNSLLQLSTILLVALIAILFVLRRQLLAPIKQLTAEAHRMADENLAAPIDFHGDNELGRVAAAMEYMRRRLLETFGDLHQKNQELIEHAASLESRVRERTAELSITNDELQQTLNSLTQTQASLVEAEKLASLGRLVAGVAHELNTPIGNALTAICDGDELEEQIIVSIASGNIRRSQLETYIGHIREERAVVTRNLSRAAQIIQDFKQLAIDQTTDMRRTFDLATVIDEVLTSIKPSFKHTPYRIETELERNISMNGFPGPLGQVITNLALNTLLHAFPGRTEGSVRLSCQRSGQDRASIICCDDGCGMDNATMHKIFDPFFTTKMGQGGSGLGLHIVHNIVTGLYYGNIEVSSHPERGTTFIIMLPLTDPESALETASE
ncbi:MAG: two-component system, NtrC family, sensor kinase, partial [Pseudomonadota bacterium]|nr:two-component system, NtrC family, sensor kinase [Pseudomonadota bacterium]